MKLTTYHFPSDLAKFVSEKWEHLVGGDYTVPPLPSKNQLHNILEVAYLAGMETEEARNIRFTLCCTPETDKVMRQHQNISLDSLRFSNDRYFDVQEIRRLATATDVEKSLIWIQFPNEQSASNSIHGLLNLGYSWSNARNAFTYHYDTLPDALNIRVIAPGKLIVYQGGYQIASLQSGKLYKTEVSSVLDLSGIHSFFREGTNILHHEIIEPEHEYVREWSEFEWLAYVNTVLAVVNNVQLQGHGGALILAKQKSKLIEDKFVKIKYKLSQEQNLLKKKFVDFMNLRHQLGDLVELREDSESESPTEEKIRLTDFLVEHAQQKLAETSEFVGKLSGVDGAIILRTDFSVEGFGTEILMDKIGPSKVYKVVESFQKPKDELDSEQFGMRHRSAMRLVSAVPDIAVFVISQDGGISLIWNDNGDVCFKSGVKTTNVNMVLP
jgi:hypothetical protein